MLRLDAKVAVPKAKLGQQLVETAVGAFECRQIGVERRFGRVGVAPPHPRLREPEQKFVAFDFVERAAALVEVADHYGDGETPEEDARMIEPEPPGDEVEAMVDLFGGAGQPGLDRLGGLVVKELELGFAGKHGVDRSQQPVEIEVVAVTLPVREPALHRAARVRPVGADFG